MTNRTVTRTRSRQRVSRNEQYFDLWQRILAQLASALGKQRRHVDLDRLELLAQQLEHAQQRGRIPTGVVRKLNPSKRHGPPPQA